MGAARPLPPSADIDPGAQSIGQAAQFCLAFRMTDALAFKMRVELAQLSRRHGVTPGISCALPLAPPSSRPILISGVASAATIDQERMKFRPWSLGFLPWKPPPLLFRGEILEIRHDSHGRVIVQARVDHAEARRCSGLSVAATIERYELRDVDDPQNFSRADPASLVRRGEPDANTRKSGLRNYLEIAEQSAQRDLRHRQGGGREVHPNRRSDAGDRQCASRAPAPRGGLATEAAASTRAAPGDAVWAVDPSNRGEARKPLPGWL